MLKYWATRVRLLHTVLHWAIIVHSSNRELQTRLSIGGNKSLICQTLLLRTYGIKLNVCGTHAMSTNLSHFVAVFYLFKHKVNNWFTLHYSPINLKLHTLLYHTYQKRWLFWIPFEIQAFQYLSKITSYQSILWYLKEKQKVHNIHYKITLFRFSCTDKPLVMNTPKIIKSRSML